MASTPKISICIPAYKNVGFLKRLLDSIAIQTFADFEIIISDDTPDTSVKNLVESYSFGQPVYYYSNIPALGTPENWNEAIRRANGEWVKLMHNDDWFASDHALELFMEEVDRNPGCSFFFAAFQNVLEESGEREIVRCNRFDLAFLKVSPLHLFRRVYVGNPSCTLVRRDVNLFYDNRFKFVVDFEYYVRCFRKLGTYRYIDKILLNIGIHKEQVTKYTFLVPGIQIPENTIMLNKFGFQILRNPVVYDYYWRMIRNLGIRSVSGMNQYFDGEIPKPLQRMVSRQAHFPLRLLKVGFISKVLMFMNYIGNLFKGN